MSKVDKPSVRYQAMTVTAIAAVDSLGRIGVVKAGKHFMPWKCPEDLKAYREHIEDSVLIVGHTTYKISPKKAFGDCPIVVLGTAENCVSATTPLDAYWEAVELATKHDLQSITVIGGAATYQAMLGVIDKIIIHEINIYSDEYVKDIVPIYLPEGFRCYRGGSSVSYPTYTRYEFRPINDTEVQWGKQIREMNHNNTNDRTGAGRIYKFGAHIRHDMSSGIPHELMRPPALRSIAVELRAIIAGITSAKSLREMGLIVWDANTTKEAQENNARQAGRVTPLAVDDIGASYGWNMTNFGESYPGADSVAVNSRNISHVKDSLEVAGAIIGPHGHQWLKLVKDVIKDVRDGTLNCRMRVSLWDPTAVSALPPCMEQFQVCVRRGTGVIPSTEAILDLTIGQRSSDALLAGHWNMSYGYLLAEMLASIAEEVTGIRVHLGDMIWNAGNMHRYGNQTEAYEKTLQFQPQVESTRYMQCRFTPSPGVYSQDPVEQAILRRLTGGQYTYTGTRPKRLFSADLPMNA